MFSGAKDGTFAPWIAAAIGVALVGVFAYLLSSERQQSHYEQYRTADYASRAKADIQRSCVGMEPTAQAECIHEIVEATNEHKRAERDLSAQQEMATWAAAMMIVSAFTALITIVGIYFVRETLLETRRLGKIEMRAYVTPVDHRFEAADPPIFELLFRNTGQTPARNVRLIGAITSRTPTQPLEFVEGDYSVSEIAAGMDYPLRIRATDMKGAAMDKFLRGDLPLWLRGMVRYTDVFNETHTTRCQHRVRCKFGADGHAVVTMVTDKEGNDSD